MRRRPRVASITAGLFLPALLIAFAAAFGATQSVSAHARLVISNPRSGAALPAMPSQITLSFSEDIDPGFSAATLRAASGDTIPIGPLTISTGNLTLSIPVLDSPAAAPGTYTLVWRVLSSVDGHVTTGTISFSAGTGAAPAIGMIDGTDRPPWWRIVLRWAEIAGLVLLAGYFTFGLFIARRSISDRNPAARLLIRTAIALLVITLPLAGYDLGITATGSGFSSPPSLSTYRDLIRNSSTAQWWVVVVACATIMAVIAKCANQDRRWSRWHRFAGLAAGLVVLFGLSASGHASAAADPWRAIVVDWVHVAAVAAWLGTLPYLWLGLGRRRSPALPWTPEDAASAIGRFSWYGLGLMAMIVTTGFLRAAEQVSGPRTLVETDYGRILIAKHLVLVPVLVAAGANLLVVVPRLKLAHKLNVPAEIGSVLRSVQRFITAELCAAVLVLLAAGALAEFAPAGGPLAVDVATKPATIDQHAAAGELDIRMLAQLTGATNDRYSLTVTDRDGQAPGSLQRVIIATSTSIDGAPVGDRFDAQELQGSPGTYVFPALRLGLRGEWGVSVIVRRAGLEDVTASFAVDTSSTGANPPRLVNDSWRLPRFPMTTWLYLGCALVVLAGGVVAIRRLPGIEPFAIAIMLTMVALITAGLAVQGYRQSIPVTAGATIANPAPADAGSIQRGETLYTTLCLQCHGQSGVGIDSDDPAHQHAGGTDLIDTRTSAQRDGDLYWSLSYGIGGTDMPAYEIALTEAERWDLVNYLRVLQGQ